MAPSEHYFDALVDRCVQHVESGRDRPFVVVIAGSVSVGKSTFAQQLGAALAEPAPVGPGFTVEVVSTDVFLLSNAELESLGGPLVKGYPQSYDWDRYRAFVDDVRSGATTLQVPTYSHENFDVDRTTLHTFHAPDVVVIEGLNALQVPPGGDRPLSASADLSLYLDAPTERIESWFVERFVAFTAAERDDPDGFYYQFTHLSPDDLVDTARWVWAEINLPNLVTHIAPSRENADLVVTLGQDHGISSIDTPETSRSDTARIEDIEIIVERSRAPRPDSEREAVLRAPDFGAEFSDHMVVAEYVDGAWGPLLLKPFGDLSLSPATLALHYGQAVFEALKAYRQPVAAQSSGPVASSPDPTLFRPQVNAARFARSCERLAMPPLPSGWFEAACVALVDADRKWVPAAEGAALYVRPFMFGSEAHLSVRPATRYQFVVIASPVASYFGGGVDAITVRVERDDVRAAPGGTGAVKFAGNYAAGFGAHGRAGAAGHDQVLWLDAREHRWVEELNAMNVMFVFERDGATVLSTPPLSGTILEGVTRDSLLRLGEDAGLVVVEEPTSIDDIHQGIADGTLREMFACGTAAVVVPIGRLSDGEQMLVVGDGDAGAVTLDLRHRLIGVQQGHRPDLHRWNVRVVARG